jgi:hypothetical protein
MLGIAAAILRPRGKNGLDIVKSLTSVAVLASCYVS